MRSSFRFAAVIIAMAVSCGSAFGITPAEIFSKASQNGTLNNSKIKDMVKVETVVSSMMSGVTETTTYSKGAKLRTETKMQVDGL